MKIVSTKVRMQFTEDGTAEIVFLVPGNRYKLQNDVSELKDIISNGKQLSVEISQYRQKRSLDANSYLWVLCHKIAEVIRSTKEEVYKKAIREVGQFEIVPIKAEAADRWIEAWNSKGMGWFSEVMEDSKLPGYKKVISYYGSSIYDTREMSVLIDNVVQDAKSLGIETMTPAELEVLKSNWR